MHFPCDEVYPRMGVEWEKSTHTMGKVWKPISIAFSCATGKFMGKPMRFPCDEVYHKMGIALERSTHIMGKVRVPISQVLPIRWILLHFPILWIIDGKTHAFPI